MIEDIRLVGLDEQTIDKMYEQMMYDEILNLACNHEKVKENINTLKSYGITNIENLIINKSYIFLKNNEELKEAFSKANIPVFVYLINNDYSIIDELFA